MSFELSWFPTSSEAVSPQIEHTKQPRPPAFDWITILIWRPFQHLCLFAYLNSFILPQLNDSEPKQIINDH